MKHLRAFTLIELILVILIISTLAVTIVPKFFDANSIAHVAIRDQLVSTLRLSQLKAMNQLDTCNRVKITDDYIVIEDNDDDDDDDDDDGNCGIKEAVDSRILLDDVTITVDGSAPTYPFFIEFDDNGISDCDCTLNVVGTETAELKIESQGYIHAL